MKRASLCLPAIVPFGSIALAQNQNQNQKKVAMTESGVVGMLALSACAISAGLILKRHKND